MPYKNPYDALDRKYRKKPWKRKAYERRVKPWIKRNHKRRFVAIDSEGFSFGEGFADHLGRMVRHHRTFLWGACDVDRNYDWLETDRALSTIAICEWLLTLPKVYKRAFFVAFSFSYDATQIVADLPYHKIWELQRGVAYDNPTVRRNIVRWKQYGFSYLKGKKFAIYKYKHGETVDYTKPVARILIYDVFGYFQSSFLKACKSLPGAVEPGEMDKLIEGKSHRKTFDPSQLAEIKSYTAVELAVLARMMERLRDAMIAEDINVTQWHGAGTIAQALLKKHELDAHNAGVRIDNLSPEQSWAHHAYFGGRIELIKQGHTSKKLWAYDIASAYPYIATSLPAMAGGTWRYVASPSREQLAPMSLVSLVEVRTHGFPEPRQVPFYPLPYRTPKGSILFPRDVWGRYCVEEVLAALDWADFYGVTDRVELVGAWEFIPRGEWIKGEWIIERPFAFLQKLFDYRASLPKDNIVQIVIKLGINAIYGKLAQAVGASTFNRGQPPKFANPWYAAAITAGTRSRILQAALHNPSAVAMFATDGIVSTSKLHTSERHSSLQGDFLHVPPTKQLGSWEASAMAAGGTFIQSGVYSISDAEGHFSAKSRGFRPAHLESVKGSVAEFLHNDLPELWRSDKNSFEFDYSIYQTLGASASSPEMHKLIGCWADGVRELQLQTAGTKRDLPASPAARRSRADRLLTTTPNCGNFLLVDPATGHMPISAPFVPEWLDETFGASASGEDEQATIALARFGDE